MKIHDNLDTILNQKSKVRILRFLFMQRDEQTGREIARGIDMSASSTHKTLKGMKDAGLIYCRKKGTAILFKLQDENYLIKELLTPLFKKEQSMYTKIISLIKKQLLREKGIVSIAIFGSVARRQETSRSDIDLLVIAENIKAKISIDNATDALSITIAKTFGASISPYILTASEIKQKHAKKLSLIKAILDNNRLIYGEPVERVLA